MNYCISFDEAVAVCDVYFVDCLNNSNLYVTSRCVYLDALDENHACNLTGHN